MARKKGSATLKRTASGNLVNKHGVEFTREEQTKLQRAVNKANRTRKKMNEEARSLPRKVYGVETGENLSQLKMMGKQSDFILSHKTSSLQRFKSRKDYDRYMANLDKINKPGYYTERIRMYKRNFMKSLEDVYGDEAKDIIMKVRMMKPEEYMKMVESDETLEISYVPSDVPVQGRLNQLRASLGMKLKDEWGEDYGEEY